ncbi:PREDICTED: cell growth regulator with RING finger domain protein 1-like [Brassica oleracea var. oleracea]|uniref:cell growth regulator with RING finger domain protein 1-like n=1 Tax=Brassica oleracea var. oleracea TaxID=109376 RepID=UPI0006A6BE9E|nr:PREDICTED: cell growth regulator with RING finger domain protein 1-like [Brassica oleracea var. oleracea]
MPKSDLVEEVRRLQAALSEQTDISKQEYEKLQDEKILCKVCIVEPIDVVLLPCKHHALCSTCYKKCEICPICRALIEEGTYACIRCVDFRRVGMHVYFGVCYDLQRRIRLLL